MIKSCILAGIAAFLASSAMAMDQQTERTIGAYNLAKEICGLGPPKEQSTQFACNLLDEAHRVLRNAGLCYGKIGQRSYVADWHKCEKRSLKPVEKITRQP